MKRSKKKMEPESTGSPIDAARYEQVQRLVAAEFAIEEGYVGYGTPTFYVSSAGDVKHAFLRLYHQLGSIGLAPLLRKRDGRIVLQVLPKAQTKPNRPWVNVALLLVTVVTTLVTGYVLSSDTGNAWVGAVLFSVALLSILGAHEMGHKLTADRNHVDATFPYFIPGVPPFMPTFGAVIQQKSLPPNRDALFDLGASGPLLGFLVTIVVTAFGVRLSSLVFQAPADSVGLPTPLLFDLISWLFPAEGKGSVLMMHPVAYAGYIGMIVTMLNLVPVGQLDGGHVVFVLFGSRLRRAFSFLALVLLLFVSLPMALIALLISRVGHPEPLDGVSGLSAKRKLFALVLVLVFVLTVAPVFSVLDLFRL